MKIINFLKYYLTSIYKTWWSCLLALPSIPMWIQLFIYFYIDQQDLRQQFIEVTEKLFTHLEPLWKWIVIIFLFFLHVRALYKLWNEENHEPLSTGMNDDYEGVLDGVVKNIPEKKDEFSKLFYKAYNCSKSGNNLKRIITRHFHAYRMIDEFLKNYMISRAPNIIRSIETSSFIDTFQTSFANLKTFNDKIGRVETIDTNEHEIKSLIDDINDTLNSFFSYL